MKAQARLGLVYTAFAPIQILVLLATLLSLSTVSGAPRTPQPPWPQATLKIFGFDADYWRGPWNNIAVNEDASTLVDSWSGYSLLRDGFYSTPVLIPVGADKTTRNVAVPYGAIRFWVAPNWSSANEKAGGKGPGRLARFLEMVNVNDKTAQVQWSLYVNEAGDTIYLSRSSKEGMIDVLKAPATFSAGDWSMVTIAYSATNTVLWLNNEVIAEGSGLPLQPSANLADLALVIGSDVYCSAESMAGAQFEELTTFERWPNKSDWMDLYFQAYKRHSLRGPISDEEAAAIAQHRAERKAKMEAEGDSGGVAMMRFASSGPSSVCVTNGPVFMTNVVSYYTTNAGWTVGFDIVGGTNGVPYDIFSATNLLGNHITNTVWQWEDVGYTCHSYMFTNQPEQMKYFILGTTNDTDADLLTDAYELLVSKTLVNDSDTDNDGMPDGWEVHNGLNPLDPADASDDPDGDWLTNLQEYNGGTNSTNPKDLMVVAWGDNSSGQCSVPLNLRDVVAVAAGFDFSLALRKDGSIVAWGNNTYGQTTVPGLLTNAISLSASWQQGGAVKADGSVAVWGANAGSVPVNLTNAVGVAVGQYHGLGLRSNGVITSWGNSPYGETNVPPSVTNVLQVTAGWSHSVALLSDRTVKAWGANFSEWGWNVTNPPPGLSNAKSIAAGGYHTLALKWDGTVVAWGAGNQTNGTAFADHRQSIIPAGLTNVVAIAAGGYRSLALRADGTLAAWGYNLFGQSSIPAGLTNIIGMAAGADHTLALRKGRQLPVMVQGPASQVALPGTNVTFTSLALGLAEVKYQWQFVGTNIVGQTNAALTLNNVSTNNEGGYTVVFSTGAGSITSSVATLTLVGPPLITNTIPTAPSTNYLTAGISQLFGMTVNATALATDRYPLRYQWFTNGVAIPSATNASYYIFQYSLPWVPQWQTNPANADYSVKVWNPVGTNQSATWAVRVISTNKPGSTLAWGDNSDGQIEYPVDLTNTLSIAASDYYSVAVKEDGSVVQWGLEWAPIPTGLTNAVAVAAGLGHTLALRDNGTVTLWGDTNNPYPFRMPTNLAGVKAVSAGYYHDVALFTNGTVTAWGANIWDLTNVPPALSNVTAISAGSYHSLAVKQDGTVSAWGYNADGQINVPAGLSNVVAVAAGGRHSLALKSDGTITGWGYNGSGQITPPSGLSNVMAIAAGWGHSVALKNDGTVVCWGSNSDGQTNVPMQLTNVKMIAAGSDHTLAGVYSSLVQYPVDVTKDLLLIYNTNSIASTWVKDYYLAHRPMVTGANVLGISFPTNEYLGRGITETPSLTNNALNPYWQWLAENPTKHPQYVIWFYDLPVQVVDGGTNHLWSPSFFLHTNTPGIKPFVTCINMRTTNDCKAYIDKLEYFGTNYAPGQLFISASKGGYGNTNFVVDSVKNGFGHFDNYTGETTVSVATNGILRAGVLATSILFADGEETITNGVFYNLPHITAATNIAGYVCWGAHSSLGDKYATNGVVHWSGNSGWWIIETIESYNGQRDNPNTDQSSVLHWYSSQAFGGTNYSNTPIGAVSHVEEPGLGGVNRTDIYFGGWAARKCFGNAAWNSRITPFYQVVGDPFTKK